MMSEPKEESVEECLAAAKAVFLAAGDTAKDAKRKADRIAKLDPYDDKRMTVTMARWLADCLVTDPAEHSGDIVRYKELRKDVKSLRVKVGTRQHSDWKSLCGFDPRGKTPQELGDWIRLAIELTSDGDDGDGLVIATHQDGGDVFHLARMDHGEQRHIAPFNRLSYCVANSFFGQYGGAPYFFIFKQKDGRGPLQQYAAILPRFASGASQALRNSDNSGRLGKQSQQRILPLISIAFENARVKPKVNNVRRFDPSINDPIERLLAGAQTPADEAWFRENAGLIDIHDLADIVGYGPTWARDAALASIDTAYEALEVALHIQSRVPEIEPLILSDRIASKRYMNRLGPADGMVKAWPEEYVAWAMSRVEKRLPRRLEARAGKVPFQSLLRYVKRWPDATPFVIDERNASWVAGFVERDPTHPSVKRIAAHLERLDLEAKPGKRPRTLRSFRNIMERTKNGGSQYNVFYSEDEVRVILQNLRAFLAVANSNALPFVLSSRLVADVDREQLDLLLQAFLSFGTDTLYTSVFENVAKASIRLGHRGWADAIDKNVNSKRDIRKMNSSDMPNTYAIVSEGTRQRFFFNLEHGGTEWLTHAFLHGQSSDIEAAVSAMSARPDGRERMLAAYKAFIDNSFTPRTREVVQSMIASGIDAMAILDTATVKEEVEGISLVSPDGLHVIRTLFAATGQTPPIAYSERKAHMGLENTAVAMIGLVSGRDAEAVADIIMRMPREDWFRRHRDFLAVTRPEKVMPILKSTLLARLTEDPLDYDGVEGASYVGCLGDQEVLAAIKTAEATFGKEAMKRSVRKMRAVSRKRPEDHP